MIEVGQCYFSDVTNAVYKVIKPPTGSYSWACQWLNTGHGIFWSSELMFAEDRLLIPLEMELL